MNVFISWSGERSNKLACLVNDYFLQNLQLTKPWLSSHIEKGKKWQGEISNNLGISNFGLIILTPENLNSSWILFEAGALSKLDSSRVFTILFDLEHNDIKPPLSQFQHTLFKKEDFQSLLNTINKCCSDETGNSLEQDTLNRIFERSWEELQSNAKAILKSKEVTTKRRTTEDKIDELLSISRNLQKRCNTIQIDGKFYQKCSDGSWRETVSPIHENLSIDLYSRIQKALIQKGYSLDQTNVIDKKTKDQLVAYQKDNNLPVGALDIETLKSLGVM